MQVGMGSAVGIALFIICVTLAFGYKTDSHAQWLMQPSSSAPSSSTALLGAY